MNRRRDSTKKQKRSITGSRANLPRTGTVPSREFFLGYTQINYFFNFVLHNVGSLEKTAQISHEVLFETAPDAESKLELEKQWAQRKSAVDELRNQRQFFIEIILVRHIENFLNYLSSLLFEIFTKRPETLRSSDKIEVEEVLRHSTIEEIVRGVAERKVQSLSYSSIRELADFFRDRFSLEIVPEKDLPTIFHAIEVRNISVHNRCVVNQRFIERTCDKSTPIGKRKELFIDYLNRLVPLIEKTVRQLDRRARSHLKLKAVRFSFDQVGV